MMRWLAVCVLATAVYNGGGVTKTSGIDQFWTDDYKVFDQVYGKTFDKQIYGTNLPPSINFAEPKKPQASEKKERYFINYGKESHDFDPYSLGDKSNLLTKPGKEKPATSNFNFISYGDFKPISQHNDPETYNYLKHLEQAEQDNDIGFVKGTGGFKPYLNYAGSNPETDAYKSIQEILDAHEANKGTKDDGNSKNLTFREKKNKKVNKTKPPRNTNKVSKPRCVPGRCRKWTSVSYRVRSRPYYRRINHRIH